MAPLEAPARRQAFDRLTQSLSLIFGTEAFVVLKDIWGLDGGEARRVAIWAAIALVRAATAEASALSRIAGQTNQESAARKTAQVRGNSTICHGPAA